MPPPAAASSRAGLAAALDSPGQKSGKGVWRGGGFDPPATGYGPYRCSARAAPGGGSWRGPHATRRAQRVGPGPERPREDVPERRVGRHLVGSRRGKLVAGGSVVGPEQHVVDRKELGEVLVQVPAQVRVMDAVDMRSADDRREPAEQQAQIRGREQKPDCRDERKHEPRRGTDTDPEGRGKGQDEELEGDGD